MGINHTTASVALREKVAFSPEHIPVAVKDLLDQAAIVEAVIVSTCNRTEIYLETEVPDGAGTATQEGASKANEELALQWLADFHGLNSAELANCTYFQHGHDVVRHLMKVSCGLDSMVLGEPQIFGQIKSAFAYSKELDAVGPRMGRAFQDAFSIAKEVRTDTAIGQNPVSVAYAAVALAERIFSDISSLSALLIGAGKTVELVAQHLREKGVKSMVVANRTLDNALDLARSIEGKGVLLSDIPEELANVDVVVSSTNSQLPLLGKGAVERALKQRRHKPMLLVDLAVPRDIEEEVGELADAYLYSVDDIGEVIEDNVKSRQQAAQQAKSIIDRGIEEYCSHIRSLNAVATLRAFRDKAETIQQNELQRALKSLEKGEAAEKVMETLARGITNKLIHSPSVQMKKASAEGKDDLLKLTQQLFELGSDADHE